MYITSNTTKEQLNSIKKDQLISDSHCNGVVTNIHKTTCENDIVDYEFRIERMRLNGLLDVNYIYASR